MIFHKKVLFFVVLSLLLLGLAACNDPATNVNEDADTSSETKTEDTSNSEETIELVVNSWFASNAQLAQNVWVPWEEYVEEETDGRVEVTVHFNGALGDSTTVLEDVKSGLYDVGMALTMYHQDIELFPATIGDLPFAGEDPTLSSYIMQEFTKKYEDMIWEDVVPMGVGAPPPRYLYSTSPIESPEHLSNIPTRVSGELDALMIQNMGGVPTEVAFEELYNSLDKGIIEAYISTHDVFTGLSLYDVSPNFLDQPITFTQASGVMNQDFYQSLPDDLQTLFDEKLNPKWEELFVENSRKVMDTNDEVIQQAEEAGGEVTTFTDEDLLTLQSTAIPVWEEWIEMANSKGYAGEEMMEEYVNISRENGVELEFLD
ncbi:TRAP transporter substrate-binding protein [Aquibacillus sediminis]|uniref:TRAP transporter substrate-binding protein n=1 Tax=Aquibacillus sediminis TaxID=2574734 RepID=UPI001107C3E3|nr:TRAP transporter substrate-binding protein DctP [Aquibacillus sediminis]